MKKSIYTTQKLFLLNGLNQFKHSDTEYSLTNKKNLSLFASIFAIFIKDLFRYEFSDDERLALGVYINSFQDKNTGIFTENKCGHSPSFYCKKCLQLTTLSMSALSILSVQQKYKINHNIKNKEQVYQFLDQVGVKAGKIGSGNFAMFLGIFLTQDNLFNPKNKLIDSWFDYHNEYYNKRSGFWTSGIKGRSQWAYQNAVHQITIFKFWNKEVTNYKASVDMIIDHSDCNGTFALLPGGGACWDYDAIHILNYLGIKKEYRVEEIKKIFNKTYNHIISTKDGIGFCENNYVQNIKLSKDINEFYYKGNPISSIFRLREFLSSRKTDFSHYPGWSNFPIKLSESDLWSIWFRNLTLAEIEYSIKGSKEWKFQKFPGLGFF